MKNRLTALLICKNEYNRLDLWLENVGFADTIVVLDSYSDDGTYAYLQKQKQVELHQRQFTDFASQRNAALKLVQTEWVLFTDADELLTEKGIAEIKAILKHPKADVYFAKRTEYIGKQRVHFSGFQSAKVPRLFKASALQFEQNTWVHEQAVFQGKSALLRHKIQHFGIEDITHLNQKQAAYAYIKAHELYADAKKYSAIEEFCKPIFKQYFNYIFRLGFLDAKLGWQICASYAYGVRQRIAKLKALHHR